MTTKKEPILQKTEKGIKKRLEKRFSQHQKKTNQTKREPKTKKGGQAIPQGGDQTNLSGETEERSGKKRGKSSRNHHDKLDLQKALRGPVRTAKYPKLPSWVRARRRLQPIQEKNQT